MCIFCKIIKGEMPAMKVYEDDDYMAFLDINPSNKGHTLVIPKEHYETFNDLPEDKLFGLTKITQKVSSAIEKATSCHGYNVMVNNYKASGQLVPHVHYHIVPRYQGDGVMGKWKHGKYNEREAEEYTKAIKSELGS